MSVKISQLPQGTAPTGSEEIPVVQASQTRRLNWSDFYQYVVNNIRSVIDSVYLQKTNNLSDLNNTATARTNLGATSIGNTLFTTPDTSTAQTALNLLPGTNIVAQTGVNASAKLPAGTTAQRDAVPVLGEARYNTDTLSFEGYGNGGWGNLGGGATGAPGNPVFYENSTNVTGNYTITTGRNAMSAGPITINNGVTVTVPNGSVWTII